MKKSLQTLILSLVTLLVPNHTLAITDGMSYEPVNGIKIENQWIFDRVHCGTAYTSNAICNQRARTATMDQGIIYVARSEERPITIGDTTILQSVIHRFSAADGSQLEDLPLYLDGAPYGRFLGVASIGKDSFHHIWVAPMTSTVQQYVPVYLVDTETGELTLVVELDKGDVPQRTDYLDIIGDITLEQAECNIMTISGATADPGFPTLYRMHADQGGEWEGGFDGDPYMDIINFYPESKTGFSLMPTIKMIEGPDEYSRYSGEKFYIDCFDTAPVVYDITGSVIDSFEETDPTLWPQFTPNGCTEFKLYGRDFLVYVNADMNGSGHGCQANICELGESQSLGGMTKYWKIPADSMGKVNDSGLRVHCFAVEYGVDEEGFEEVTLLTFKAYNGMAVYKLSVIDESALFVINGIRYKKKGVNQVQVESLVANTGVVEIPETVTYEGVNYEVTSIGSGVFRDHSLDLLMLPNSITSIGPDAFMGCSIQSLFIAGDGAWQGGSIDTNVEGLYIGSGVTSIYGLGISANEIFSYASTPPACDEHTFIDYSATLHVLGTSFAAYFVAPYWCNFGNIVGDAVEPLGVVINIDSLNLLVNEQLDMTATVTPANATPHTVMWRTTDASVATVNNGLVMAVGQGECDIIASCLNKKAVCHITASVIEVTSISLSQEEAFLEVNEQVSLTAAVTPDNATYGMVSWQTTDGTVATVDANGTVRAVGAGECDILAVCGGQQAECHVIVVPQKIYITLDKHTAKVLPNHMVTLIPSMVPVSTELNVISTDPTVAAARIVNGVVQVVGITEGTVTITVGSVDGYAFADTCQVTVYTEHGDVNCDGYVSIADVTSLIDYLLSGDDSHISTTNADVNKSDNISIADVTTLIDYLLSGAWPWEPEVPTEPTTETFTVNGVSFTMVAIEGGTFTMGATAEQGYAYSNESPTHQVTLSSYSIGETEVTQALWQAVMGSNPSYYTDDLQRPVEFVSWNDCQTFITTLNQLTGKTFRLPTEAEWEYAARGGNRSRGYKYAGSNDVGEVAWYWDNIPSQSSGTPGYGTQPVATKSPNELGLYDMTGNVWEWCQDRYGSYTGDAQTNPTGPASGSYRVYRGGSWGCVARSCRVSRRSNYIPSVAGDDLGLRLAL